MWNDKVSLALKLPPFPFFFLLLFLVNQNLGQDLQEPEKQCIAILHKLKGAKKY